MKDLTQGPVWKHLFELAAFMGVSMLFQTLYFLIDLYFVSGLGKEAVAGVSLSGVLMMTIIALTQMLAVGTTTLISHAVGRKDRDDAQLVFNQSFIISLLVGALVVLVGFTGRFAYCRALAADEATVQQGVAYLTWYIPALGGQFAIAAMGAALRGTGIVKPSMTVQIATVIVNAALAPVLIVGWGTGHAFGVAGAAMATFISVIVGIIAMTIYFIRLEHYVSFIPSLWSPQWKVWKRVAVIGLPAGGEFALISLYSALVYFLLRPLGATAQAGFGIGGRIMQSAFLPVMAVSFAAAPLAGQNFGARRFDRVRETFGVAARLASTMMLVVTLLCQFSPAWLIRIFSTDPGVIEFGVEYLRIVSWNFVASGFIFACSAMFQSLGNTVPSLLASCGRVIIFAIPAMILGSMPGFRASQLWWLSIFSIVLQAIAAYWLLQREFALKLGAVPPSPAPSESAAV